MREWPSAEDVWLTLAVASGVLALFVVLVLVVAIAVMATRM